MQSKTYLLFLWLGLGMGLSSNVFAQDDQPTAAPSLKTFALNPNQAGAAANSVNLFTGDVALPMNLLSLPGHNGLGVDVSISYSSNAQHVVNTWNLEAPTGILGVGWSMDVPKIMCDHKQTGTREDDEYYLVEGGSSSRLIRTTSGYDSGGSYYVYELKNYQFWKVKYYYDYAELSGSTNYGSGPNKWEIVKEDGSRYVYGDKNSGRSTIQWVVRWDNWIGNSALTSWPDWINPASTKQQEQMAYIWNLSEIINLWGEKITFEYESVDQFVGSNQGKKHTEASYLKRITDVVGRRVDFIYKDKLTYDDNGETVFFYQEPHTELGTEPDAYQEVYEKKMLDYIEVYRETNDKLFSIHLSYTFINHLLTYQAKPLLAGIVQKNANGDALPGIQFEYYAEGPEKGCLKTMTTPTKGTITYTYKKDNNLIGHSSRQSTFPIQAPAGYAEPKVWIEDDYVVVAWRELNADGTHGRGPKDVALYVYQWVGEWKEQFLGYISGIELNNFRAAGGDDYKNFQIQFQKDFFAVLTPAYTAYHRLFVYYKDEQNRGQWKYFTPPAVITGNGTPTLLSGNQFVAVGSQQNASMRTFTYTGNDWQLGVISQPVGDYFYTATNNYIISHDEERDPDKIYFNFLSEDKKWTTREMPQRVLFSSADRNTHWHAANSFALGMVSNNSEFFYRWDLTYSTFYRDNVLGELRDEAPVSIMNNSMVGIYGNIARFDGSQWRVTRVSTYNNYDASKEFSYGDDVVIRPLYNLTNGFNGGRRVFNPNTLSWGTDANLETYGSTNRFNRVGIDHYFFGKDCYYRYPNGAWGKIFTIPGSPDRTSWYQGYPRLHAHSPSKSSTDVFAVKNGSLLGPFSLSRVGLNQVYPGNGASNTLDYFPRSILAGNQTIVSVPTSVSSTYTSNITAFQLNRLVDDAIGGQQVDYPVITITVNDGNQSIYTSFQYDFATATMGTSGMVAQYNKVKVVPGSSDANVAPNGYTLTYFHNGLTRSQAEPELPVATSLLWIGAPYLTKVFNTSNNLVSENTISYSTYARYIKNTQDNRVAIAYYVRQRASSAVVDGIETITVQEYDESTGMVASVRSEVMNNGIAATQVVTHYKYFWQQYDPNREKNILTPVIQTKKTITSRNSPDGKVVDMAATTWKQWNGVYAPHKAYRWQRTNSADFDFTNWSGTGEPTIDWQKVSEIDNIDAKGNVLQTTRF